MLRLLLIFKLKKGILRGIKAYRKKDRKTWVEEIACATLLSPFSPLGDSLSLLSEPRFSTQLIIQDQSVFFWIPSEPLLMSSSMLLVSVLTSSDTIPEISWQLKSALSRPEKKVYL